MVATTENNAFAVTNLMILNLVSAFSYTNGNRITSLHTTEPFSIKPVYFWMYNKPQPYLNKFAKFVNLYTQHGITTDLLSRGLEKDFPEYQHKSSYRQIYEDLGPQVLTMDHMEIAFIFSLCPLILSFLSFLGELFIFWIKKKFKRRQEKKNYEKQFKKATRLEKAMKIIEKSNRLVNKNEVKNNHEIRHC